MGNAVVRAVSKSFHLFRPEKLNMKFIGSAAMLLLVRSPLFPGCAYYVRPETVEALSLPG